MPEEDTTSCAEHGTSPTGASCAEDGVLATGTLAFLPRQCRRTPLDARRLIRHLALGRMRSVATSQLGGATHDRSVRM
jgi:hypothetical protein